DDNLLGPRGARLEAAAPAVHETVRRDGPRVAEPRDLRGTGPPQGASGPSGLPGDRGLGGPRGRTSGREGDLLPRVRPQPCPPAPDRHRARDAASIRTRWRVSGPHD